MAGQSWLQILRTQGGGVLPNFEPVIWLSVEDEHADMLSDDVYDAFVLIPLYIAMYYKQDLHIHGSVSKKLYKNVVDYFQYILCGFSPDLSRVNVSVDGFKIADGNPSVIGTGFSCGVDSLSTVYDRYVKEDDPDYRINALFFLDTGWHGDVHEEESIRLCMEHYSTNKKAADELGLPLYLVRTNFHAFIYEIYYGVVGKMGYLANYSCALGLQRAVKKYYISNALSYEQILIFGYHFKGKDFSEYSESYSVPLIQTEKINLVIDGCQYERSQKVEKLADWEIAQKYLTPCAMKSFKGREAHADNCSECVKCLRTLLPLEALGKLKNFSRVFDVGKYRKLARKYKFDVVFNNGRDGFSTDNYKFCVAHGLKMPSYFTAWMYFLSAKLVRAVKIFVRKITGDRFYDAVKKKLKGDPPVKP